MDEILGQKTVQEIERAELNLLIAEGFRIEVLAGKRKKVFKIAEPTLAVLDRISDISLGMIEVKDDNNNADVFATARRAVRKNSKRMALVIAVVVLGESYYTTFPILKHVLNIGYRYRLRQLTNLFMHTITPSQLVELSAGITGVSNLGDFMRSMRLLSDARTTRPIRESIE
jgi:hypothetical protein